MHQLIRVNQKSATFIDDVFLIEKDTFPDYWNKEHISAEFSSNYSFSFLLLIDNSVIGYLFSTKLFDEVQLNKICIHQSYRNMNYGFYLLNFLIAEAIKHAVQRIILEVNEQNVAAVKLYSRTGFKTIRKRLKIYSNRFDGLEMMLNLDSYTESPFTFSIEHLP